MSYDKFYSFVRGRISDEQDNEIGVCLQELREEDEWLCIKNSFSVFDINKFLRKFPNGKYYISAKQRLELLTDEKALWKSINKDDNSQLKEYMRLYPSGYYVKRALDLTVENVYANLAKRSAEEGIFFCPQGNIQERLIKELNLKIPKEYDISESCISFQPIRKKWLYSIIDRFINFFSKQNVYSSVFAPSEISPKSHMMVQVYLHLNEETEIVKRLAMESDKNAERRDYIPLQIRLNKGDKIIVELNIFGDKLLFHGFQSVIWQGSFCKCAFDYYVPLDIDGNDLSCSATIYVNEIIAGEMLFNTKIVNNPTQLNTNVISKKYKTMFLSYSHKDEEIAIKIKKSHEKSGIKVFRDKDDLKPGDIFTEVIFDRINHSDVFVLCWSENAAKSEYVAKERKEALKLAYPQIKPREQAKLSIKTYNITPYATPPEDMVDIYHFEKK